MATTFCIPYKGDHFGSILDNFGIILGQFWDHFGIILGPSWDHFGPFSDHFGIILGSYPTTLDLHGAPSRIQASSTVDVGAATRSAVRPLSKATDTRSDMGQLCSRPLLGLKSLSPLLGWGKSVRP